MTTANHFLELVYMDDVFIMRQVQADIIVVNLFLVVTFIIKDLDYIKYFFSFELAYSTSNVLITQDKYIRDMLVDTRLVDYKAMAIPLISSHKFTTTCSILYSIFSAIKDLLENYYM